MENAVKIVDHFSKVFDIDYMLPKCDLVAVHEFSHGAMENWGLITYVFLQLTGLIPEDHSIVVR